MARTLTRVQSMRLDRLAYERPEAKVIAWHPNGGPVIRSASGGTQFVNRDGRLKPVGRDALTAIRSAVRA